ncbi:MAG TPA: alpha/beta fold hydrolase [Solirubrobacteraceae bacterium]|nr:alpha/beta fold hydrolase [Solirubrobacteraceae bacterium]
MPEHVVLLHGFSGTHRVWDEVIGLLDRERYLPRALDLPGHGRAAAHGRPLTFAGCVVHVLAAAPPRFVLCGYSLGGRVALHVALAAPERVTRLVLVSTSAGIEDAAERARRRESDRRLAAQLRQGDIEAFIESWRSQPLFAGEPAAVGELARADQRRNRADALADVLAGLGSGAMEPLWERLGELAMPVTALAGERDRKYVELGRRMVRAIPNASLQVVRGGHRLALENPAAVAAALATGRPRPPAQTGL